MGLTQALAKYVVNLRYEDIPDSAVDLAKKAMLDFLGVAIAGKEWESPRIVKEYVLEHGGSEECSVPGHSFRTSPALAALLCGTMSHVLDYDDVHYSQNGHGGVVIFPAIWALGDKYNISGKRAIEAFIVGWEVSAYLGKLLAGGSKAFHSTSQVGVLSAAMAAAKIMNLTEVQTRAAIGIASSMSSGLKANFGTMTKSLHPGNASHDGVMAAILAKKNFTANPDILEVNWGFQSGYGSPETTDAQTIADLLGSNYWDISAGGGIAFKMHPCCYMSHCSIDAMIDLAVREDIKADDVETICVEAPEFALGILQVHDPRVGLAGKFCLEYVVSAAILYRKVGLEEFTDEKVEELRPLMKKVTSRPKPNVAGSGHPMFEMTHTVEVKLKDGRTLTNTLGHPLGDPKNPVNWEQLMEKYRECVSLYFAETDVDMSGKIIRSLEHLGKFRELVEILAK